MGNATNYEDREPEARLGMMMRNRNIATWAICVLGALVTTQAFGQAGPEDDMLDTVRGTSPSQSDQRRIQDWAQEKVASLKQAAKTDSSKALRDYRAYFNNQYNNTGNDNAFRLALAGQMAIVASSEFQAGTDAMVSQTLARLLLDFGTIETLPGLSAGLSSTDQPTRFLCASALSRLTTAIGGDKTKFDATVSSLQAAGQKETNPVVLSRIYLALSFTNAAQIPAAADAILAIMESRVTARRAGQVGIDRAEVDALRYFRSNGVAAALSQPQRSKLVLLTATFLRMDADQFNKANVTPDDLDHLLRRLVQEEEVLVAFVGNNAGVGNITKEIDEGGHLRRNEVLQQAYMWVGDPTNQTAGALNAAPWNVPIGAP